MAEETVVNAIQGRLFAESDLNVYAILDGASVPHLPQQLWECRPEHYCLFPGDLEPDMAEVAPYLVKLEAESDFGTWVLEEGWGNHWGVLATTPVEGIEARKHFASLIDVYDADGKPLIFRYYDPRVLRVFLPTCDRGELTEFFGPVSVYLAEAEDAESLACFRREAGRLRTQELRLAGP